MQPLIVGAGLAGLITACHFKEGFIIDAAKKGAQHQALLRFRDTSVSELTGIPFKKVEVSKDIYNDGALLGRCSISDANKYAYKVSGAIGSRSITNLDTVSRYVAPDDFYSSLVERHASRIMWDTPFNSETLEVLAPGTSVITTAPMSVALAAAGIPIPDQFRFQKAGIEATRIKLNVAADVYQTIYFPDHSMKTFRASITGDTLIIERLVEAVGIDLYSENDELLMVCHAFGISINLLDYSSAFVTPQQYGKILDMPRDMRQALMYELTSTHSIFSLGRFATWRNILLDDVVGDIHTIDRLMKSSAYSRSLMLKS